MGERTTKEQQNKRRPAVWGNGIAAVAILLLLTACGQTALPPATQEMHPAKQATEAKAYEGTLADSLDEAVLLSKEPEKEKIHLQNIKTGKTYTLTYSSATRIQDPNGKELVMEQLEDGSLVTVAFLRAEKQAKGLYQREDAAAYRDVTMFEINKAAHTMTFDGGQYKLDEHVAVVMDGGRQELMNINAQDTLTVRTVGHTVYSLVVTKGHGYVRLLNYDFFVGGWVEVGQSVIKPVTEGMLLTVPEGKYQLYISNHDVGGTKEIEVANGAEVEVDVGDLQGEGSVEEIGQIIFTISPENAVLTIDGTQTDYSKEVNLGYGVHKLVCSADGYVTLGKYIKVTEKYAGINIELEKQTEKAGSDPKKTVSANSVSINDMIPQRPLASKAATSDYQVYIDAPVGAELYVDDNYIGLIPTSFPKTPGNYTVSVRKTGYHTRSYSLQIDDSAKDVNYSFSELTEQQQE